LIFGAFAITVDFAADSAGTADGRGHPQANEIPEGAARAMREGVRDSSRDGAASRKPAGTESVEGEKMHASANLPGQPLKRRKNAPCRPVLGAFLGLVLTVLPAYAVTPEEALRKDFSELKFDRIGPSPVAGMAEVIVGPDILYYVPGEGVILTGEMISRERKNLTRQRKGELQAEQLKILPLDLAVRIGTGSHTVIEFTDPNCPYCRQASKYLKDRTDLSRYIFFFPLSPKSEDKIRYVLCAPDRGKAYEDVMAGARDGVGPEVCKNPQADEMLKQHRELGQRLGLEGTPFFVIDGEVVAGADLPRMEKLLEGKKP